MNKRTSTRAAAVSLLLFGTCFWAQAQTSSEFVLAQGEAVYRQHCAVCHGQNGRPDTAAGRLLTPSPRNFADPVDMARVSFDQIYTAIKEGRPGTAMAPWESVLTDVQIGHLVDYIRAFVPANVREAPYEASVELGRRLYQRSCVVCHGAGGHADTQAAGMLVPSPTPFADPVAMARVDDGRMYMAITKGVPGSGMSSWEHALVPAEVIDIMRYIRTLEQPLPANMSQSDLDLTVGRNIFSEHCVACHAENGNGRTPLTESLGRFPRDFTNPAAMRAVSDEALREAILHGRPGSAMAPWRGILNEEDVRRVIVYIRRAFQGSP